MGKYVENTGVYSTGEKAKLGDRIKCVSDISSRYYGTTLKRGREYIVTNVMESAKGGVNLAIENANTHESKPWGSMYRVNRFALVSRADGSVDTPKKDVFVPQTIIIMNQSNGTVEARVKNVNELEETLFNLFKKNPNRKLNVYSYRHTVEANMSLQFKDALKLEGHGLEAEFIDTKQPVGSDEVNRTREGFFRKT